MFDVTLYTFAKKQRSTKIPSGTGTTVSCMAKEPLDILNPVIRLQLSGGAAANPQAYNYARINALERWYHIRIWRNVGPIWEAELQVDALASWRLTLGAQRIYVYRSAYSYDLRIPDTVYPSTARQHRFNVTLPRPWTIGGASASGAAEGSGVFVVGILTNDKGTVYGAFTPAQFEKFINALFSDQFYETVLGVFGATEYPEAKVAVNPAQFLSSVKFCPVGLITSGYWGIRWIDQIFGCQVGPANLDFLETGVNWYRLTSSSVPSANAFSISDIVVSADLLHPQADERGEWLNYAPYTSYELLYPPFGLLQLDPVEVSSHDNLRIRLSLDVRTCTCTLEVQVYDQPADMRTILKTTASFGVDVPVSNIIQPGTSTMQMVSATIGSITSAVGSALTGDVVGAASGIFGAFSAGAGTAVKGQIPHVSQIGGPGSTASLDGTPRLYVTHWYMANDDLNDKGRPLCAVRQISAIPGYIMGDPDSLSIACTLQEMEEIRQAVAGGFYYE